MQSLNKQLKIPKQLQQTARTLIDQQMWCWGCDVRRADGNLLSLYGAHKRPSPNPRYHSAYMFQLEEQAVINLWGWGLWLAHPQQGSLFIARSRFKIYYTPEFIAEPDAWRKSDLPSMGLIRDNDQLTHANDLLAKAMHWIGTYEAWVNTQVNSDYREQIITKWPQKRRHKNSVPATEMAEEWLKLSTSMMHSIN